MMVAILVFAWLQHLKKDREEAVKRFITKKTQTLKYFKNILARNKILAKYLHYKTFYKSLEMFERFDYFAFKLKVKL